MVMWERIRQGVRWRPLERYAIAVRALNLKDVEAIHVSFDPFHADNTALRWFWHAVSTPKVKITNPRVRITSEVRNDRQDPFFVADLADKRRLVFKTTGMQPMDVVMRFNKLTGNPEFGNAGLRSVPGQ